jgi:hypothetical protein
VIDVVTVITAKGENNYDIDPRNRNRSSRRGRGAESHQKGQPCATGRPRWEEASQVGQKASQAKKARTGAKKAKVAHEGSKTGRILDLLKRPGGVTSKELMKATGWQPHSVRGFLSGTIGKKMGLTVVSSKGEDGERSYSVKG